MENIHEGGVKDGSFQNKEYRDASLLHRSTMDNASTKIRRNIQKNQYLKKFAHENKIKVPILSKQFENGRRVSKGTAGPIKRLRQLVQRKPRDRREHKKKEKRN